MKSATDQEIPRKVPASQGLQWVVDGFRLYRKNALLLSAAFAALFGVVMALGLIPVIGGAVSQLASPLMMAGFLAAYRAVDSGNELELPHFLAGVRGLVIPLMTVGAVQLLGSLAIFQVMLGMGFDLAAFREAVQSQNDPAKAQAVVSEAMPAVLTGLLLFTPLVMATWFAPALIVFGGARPLTALGVSLKAVARNWTAVVVNGFALGLLLFVTALVPLGLGLLVAMPVMFGAVYAAYQAIFAVWADEAQAGDNLA